MTNGNKKKKKSGGIWVWLLIFAFGLISQQAENPEFRRFFRRFGNSFDLDSPAVFGIAGAVVLGVFLFVLIRGLSAAIRRQAESAPTEKPRSRHTASQEFPVPDAHCVVCETTGEDHFARDKILRIQQLDDWLKNGLIDRAEYKVLKDRFEKDL
jgi:hypothetical protein